MLRHEKASCVDEGSLIFVLITLQQAGNSHRRKLPEPTLSPDHTSDSDHHDCDADSEPGCVRCHVTEPEICCDIHNPTAFAQYESYIPRPSRPPRPSRLPKYTKDKYDYKLERALEDWREEKTKDVYGWASYA